MPALPGSNQTSKSELLLNQTGESVLSMERESRIRMERESCIREARICSKYGARILYFVKRESVLSMERGHLESVQELLRLETLFSLNLIDLVPLSGIG